MYMYMYTVYANFELYLSSCHMYTLCVLKGDCSRWADSTDECREAEGGDSFGRCQQEGVQVPSKDSYTILPHCTRGGGSGE